MARIITTYIAVLVLVSLSFIGVGAIASVAQLQDSTQPINAVTVKIRDVDIISRGSFGARINPAADRG